MERLNGTTPLARYEIASGETIVAGNIVALNASGKAVPASDAAALKVVGIALRVLDGYVQIDDTDNVVMLANSGTHALARTDRGSVAYVEDASTVASASDHKIAAGLVVDVTDDGVYVDQSPIALASASLAASLVAASAAIADVAAAGTDSVNIITALNALLAAARTHGIIASE